MTDPADPIDVLRARGFVAAVTDEPGLRRLFAAERVTYYVGFDPTAPSLHIGNLVGIMAMAQLQRLGHRPIAIAGGATGRIGDPSGRDDERELLDESVLERNLASVRTQLGAVLDLSDPERGLLVDNFDWTVEVRLLDFLRDVGKHFSVNQMIARESVKKRLDEREQGISFTEFSYQLLQAFDFAHLFGTYGCRLQGGGSDQWGNITAGIDLTRRLHGAEVYGLTWPLIETSDGRKFGKSAGNAVWLDPTMVSPYGYYQWWVNSADRDVVPWLKLFTFLDLAAIDEVSRTHAADPSTRAAHRLLGAEATRIVHGDTGVAQAERATSILFGEERFEGLDDATLASAFDAAPSTELPRADLEGGIGVVELLTRVGAAGSNAEARRLIAQGGVSLNNVRLSDDTRSVTAADLASATMLVVRVGKKRYHLARFA